MRPRTRGTGHVDPEVVGRFAEALLNGIAGLAGGTGPGAGISAWPGSVTCPG